MKTFSLGRGNFQGVAYSPDGRYLVSLNSGRRIRFWDLATFTERLAFLLPPGAHAYDPGLSLHGDLLVLRGSVWDIAPAWQALHAAAPARGKGRLRLDSPPYRPITLKQAGSHVVLGVRADGEVLAGLVWDYGRRAVRLLLWDRQGRCRGDLGDPGLWSGFRPALSPDGRLLAAQSRHQQQANNLLLLSLEGEAKAGALKHTDGPNRALFSPDGRTLAVAAGRCVWLWDVATRRPLTRFPAFRRHVEALAFHPSGRLLGAGGRDGEIRLWDVSTLQQAACLDWQVGAVHALAFAPDGMTVAAAGHKSTVVLWDLDEV